MYIIDTNILIDYLKGFNKAKQTLEKYTPLAISIISYFEIIVGVKTNNKQQIKDFLSYFAVCGIDENMVEEVANIRNNLKVKLPDAIILATAKINNAKLIIRNTKDFKTNDKNIIIPYQI